MVSHPQECLQCRDLLAARFVQDLCCDVQFRKEARGEFVTVGGLDGYNSVLVENYSKEEASGLIVKDYYTPALVKWGGERGQDYLKESSIELATLFSPSILSGIFTVR